MPRGVHVKKRPFAAYLLIAVVTLLYLPLVRYPFVQDDWALLHEFAFQPASALVLDILSPVGKLFYRPAGDLYSAIVCGLFGLNATGCHLLSMLLLGISSFLVVSLARHCTGDSRVAWGSGFIYAAASRIHLDSQMWLAGIFDTGAIVCSLACIAAFLRTRTVPSVLWFALALGCKESALPLVIVLLAYALVVENHEGRAATVIGALYRRLRVHVIVLVVYLASKVAGISLFRLPPEHPYAARVLGEHTRDHFLVYAGWVLQAVTPTKNIAFSGSASLLFLAIALAGLAIVFLAVAIWVQNARVDVRGPARLALFLGAWGLLMMVPPVALQHQMLRYYLGIVLPPFAIGTMLVVRALFVPFGKGVRGLAIASTVIATVNVIDGTLFIQHRISLGAQEGIHSSGREGDNHLIRKASVVREVWKPLMALVPSVPQHSVIIMEGVATGTFADRLGPQVWYGDSTLQVTSILPAPPDTNGFYRVTLPPEDPWKDAVGSNVVTVPAARLVHVRDDQGTMVLVNPGM